MSILRSAAVTIITAMVFLSSIGQSAAAATAEETAPLAHSTEAPPAETDAQPNSLFVWHRITDKSKTSNYVRRAQTLATCKAVTTGVTCTISKSASSTRTVQVGLGLKREDITSNLGFSSSSTVSVTVSCTSPKMSKGQVFKAFPLGDHHRYKVVRESMIGTEKTGWLYAFNPYTNGFACGF